MFYTMLVDGGTTLYQIFIMRPWIVFYIIIHTDD